MELKNANKPDKEEIRKNTWQNIINLFEQELLQSNFDSKINGVFIEGNKNILYVIEKKNQRQDEEFDEKHKACLFVIKELYQQVESVLKTATNDLSDNDRMDILRWTKCLNNAPKPIYVNNVKNASTQQNETLAVSLGYHFLLTLLGIAIKNKATKINCENNLIHFLSPKKFSYGYLLDEPRGYAQIGKEYLQNKIKFLKYLYMVQKTSALDNNLNFTKYRVMNI